MARPRIKNIQEIERAVPLIPAKVEKVYRLAKEGTIGNLRVEEITIQGIVVIERRWVSERDAKPFALSKLMTLVEDRVRKEFP